MTSVNYSGYAPGHLQYGDFLMGPGTNWKWDQLEGWEETPAIDSGTVLKASDHGGWPGTHYAQTRTVTASLVVRSEPGQMNQTVRQLAAATPIDEQDEKPLLVQLDDESPLLVFARCIRRTLDVTRSNRTGLTRGAIQWVASDPRKYTLLESTEMVGLPQPEAGLAFPLAFPLDFGTVGSTGNVSPYNMGDAPTHPVLAITGPCTTPSVTNINTGDLLEYDISLASTDTLYVDTFQGTVTLNGTEANRLYTATTRSAPESSFTFPPGSTALAFRSDDSTPDPASTLTVTWRSAFW